MIELAGLLYALAKDLGSYAHWIEAEKLVDFHWPEVSGFKAKAEAEGYSVSWSRPDKIASRALEGSQVLYEIDKVNRIRYRIVLRDGLTLIGKKAGDDAI